MKKAVAVVMLVTLLGATGAAARAETEVTGTWVMDNGKVTVRVSSCGASLCGTIVGLKKPLDKNGNAKLDRENPNPALRSRPVIGLTILSNMRPAGSNRWKGKIYNPDDGKTYTSRMKLQGDNVMKVEGCVAGVLCKAMKFVRIK